MSNNLILVTGATGAVGRETLKALQKIRTDGGNGSAFTVRAQYRKEEQKSEIQKSFPDAEFVNIDYSDIDSVFNATKGCTTVFIITPYTVDQNVMARLLIDGSKKKQCEIHRPLRCESTREKCW